MDWKKLFDMQKELDTYIETNHNVKQAELLDKKILALLVEVGELANETRCFKFWSKKKPSERDVIIEEYVDGIHFLLSLGLNKNFTFSPSEAKEKKSDLTEQFNQVFSTIISFRHQSNIEAYNEMFNEYITLGNMLEFTQDDIYQAYIEKNEVNHQRQNTDY